LFCVEQCQFSAQNGKCDPRERARVNDDSCLQKVAEVGNLHGCLSTSRRLMKAAFGAFYFLSPSLAQTQTGIGQEIEENFSHPRL
jgi:hypothetical protein